MSKAGKKRKVVGSGVPFARGFNPPGAAKIKRALGKLDHPDAAYEDDQLTPFFQTIPNPSCEDDWLAQYNETGQTYDQFMQQCPWLSCRRLKYMKQTFNKSGTNLVEKYPDGKIYLLPLGSFGEGMQSEQFEKLVDYTKAFFGSVPVVQLSPVDLDVDRNVVYWDGTVETGDNGSRGDASPPAAKRRKPSGGDARGRRHALSARFHQQEGGERRIQLRVDGVLDRLRRSIPDDALCLVALTMFDLFDTKPDLFVAGMAAGAHRVAVFSFFRYHPDIRFSSEFWHDIWLEGGSGAMKLQETLLLRSCRLLVHEVSHLLAIDHCIFHACCMNGSGHLQEDFAQPMHLCPVDLRKLQVLCGFDVLDRYRKLADFFNRNNLDDEYKWCKRRIKFIEDGNKEASS